MDFAICAACALCLFLCIRLMIRTPRKVSFRIYQTGPALDIQMGMIQQISINGQSFDRQGVDGFVLQKLDATPHYLPICDRSGNTVWPVSLQRYWAITLEFHSRSNVAKVFYKWQSAEDSSPPHR